MRTHNLTLIAVVVLVLGGLFFAPLALRKGGFVEEHAVSNGNSLVATAQGANLDLSDITVQNGTFSSLSSPADLGIQSTSILYTDGAAQAPSFLPIKK
ncbi:MAG: hypothetical protein KGJ13_04890 [Patescibacteria group bacterium]|nr:hypothetical protein [Patescibacteria group bacterium]